MFKKLGKKIVSRWRELNPRPIPYQGIAIPLSHSGTDSAALNIKEGYFTFFLTFA